jgi:hypothetical protein
MRGMLFSSKKKQTVDTAKTWMDLMDVVLNEETIPQSYRWYILKCQTVEMENRLWLGEWEGSA